MTTYNFQMYNYVSYSLIIIHALREELHKNRNNSILNILNNKHLLNLHILGIHMHEQSYVYHTPCKEKESEKKGIGDVD